MEEKAIRNPKSNLAASDMTWTGKIGILLKT